MQSIAPQPWLGFFEYPYDSTRGNGDKTGETISQSMLACLERGFSAHTTDCFHETLMSHFFFIYGDGVFRSEFALKKCVRIARILLEQGGNLNAICRWRDRSSIIEVSHLQLSCWQVAYFTWKLYGNKKSNSEKQLAAKQIFELCLNDPSIDVHQRFRKCQVGQSVIADSPWEEGCILEDATVLHHAIAVGDIATACSLLAMAPDLCQITCKMAHGRMQTRSLWSPEIERLDPSEGIVELCFSWNIDLPDLCLLTEGQSLPKKIFVENSLVVHSRSDVTILHLAVRTDPLVCQYVLGILPDLRNAEDSEKLIPYDYLQQVERYRDVDLRLFKQLEKYDPLSVRLPNFPTAYFDLLYPGYCVRYDPSKKLAVAIYERLNSESLKKGAVKNSRNFQVDLRIPTLNSARNQDYRGTKYDRGHGRSNANAQQTEELRRATYFLPNAMPMDQSLNRGYWKTFEETVRRIIAQAQYVEVVTGPIFKSNARGKMEYKTIGDGEIHVPTHFYKIIRSVTVKGRQTSGYIIPHGKVPRGTPLEDFAVSSDAIQRYSGLPLNKYGWQFERFCFPLG